LKIKDKSIQIRFYSLRFSCSLFFFNALVFVLFTHYFYRCYTSFIWFSSFAFNFIFT